MLYVVDLGGEREGEFLLQLTINAEKLLLYLYLIFSFKKQILQAVITDLLNRLVPRAHHSIVIVTNLLFPLQIKRVKVS